jgi:membrane fusion protein, heavy metal efflux system
VTCVRRPTLLHLALGLAAGAFGLAGCDKAPAPAADVAAPVLASGQLRFPPGHPQLAQIGVTRAQPAKPIQVDMPARLVWNDERTQRIYPAFAGRVARILVDVGQPVKPGTVLAQLASPEFGAAQADTAKAQADARFAQQTLARQRELFEAGIVSRKELEQAEADAARSRAEIQRAEARTRLYGGRAGVVDQQLALVSGIAGVVVERNLNPGQEVRPDQAGPGTPALFVLSDPTSLWVQIDVRESEVGALRPGADFDLIVPALAAEKFSGRVTAAADSIDPATRTIKVRGVIANPERKLKAEMLAAARVQHAIGEGVLIPSQAVALQGERHSVIVQVSPGVFEPREVTLGYQGPREVLVTRGLAAGEQVVSENMLLLQRQYRMIQELGTKSQAPGAEQQAAR